MAKYLIEEVLPRIYDFLEGSAPEGGLIVAFFFCSYRSATDQTLMSLLCSLIHQLISQLPNIGRVKQLMRDRHMMLSLPSDEALHHVWAIFQDLVSDPLLRDGTTPEILEPLTARKELYLALDALDELSKSHRDLFLERFCRIMRKLSIKAPKVIITSRNEPDIAAHMGGLDAWHLSLGTAHGNGADLANYVKNTVSTYGEENGFGENLSQVIISELSARANDIFLWASLAWSFLIEGVGIWTEKKIRERLQVLQRLPAGMKSLYRRILDDVDPGYRNDLLLCLQLIVSAARPLDIAQVEIALALRDRPRRLRDIERRLNIRAFFRRACPHLVKVDQDGMISLVHVSCKDYLVGIRMISEDQPAVFHIDTAAANLDIGLDCLSYISLGDFTYQTSLESACEENKFLSYAHQYWLHHLAGRNDRARDIWFYLSRLFDHSTKRFRWYDESELVIRLWNSGLDRLLELAAEPPFQLGLNVTDIHRDHFIHTVVTNIRKLPVDSLRYLTALGLDINGQTRFKQTLLHRCIAEWKNEQFDSQTGKESDLNPGKAVDGPLASEKSLYALLSFPGVDPNVVDVFGYSPLSFAIFEGLDKVVEILLSSPNLSFSDSDGSTALHIAAEEGVLMAVEVLTSRGVSVHGKTSNGETALHLAARGGHLQVLKLLSSKSPSQVLNAKDNHGWTIAHRAVTSGNEQMTLWLAECPLIDVGLRDKHGRRPAAFAAAYGTLAMLKGILDRRPDDVAHIDSFGNTLFHMAALGSNMQNFSYLLELAKEGRIARPGANSWGRTVADVAATQGMVAYLLELGFQHSPEYLAFQRKLASENIRMSQRADESFPSNTSKRGWGGELVVVANPEDHSMPRKRVKMTEEI